MEDLESQLFTLLAGREGKKPKTLTAMMRTFRRMRDDGFDFTAFMSSEEAAQAEGDRYFLWLTTQPPRKRGRRQDPQSNGRGGHKAVKAVLLAMGRLKRFDLEWRVKQKRPGLRDCYTADELRRLLTLPYDRTELRRLERAAIMAHLGLGWRLDELAPLQDFDLHPSTHSAFMRNPQKDNPQRELPLEEEFFSGREGLPGARNPLMSWLRERPVWKQDPHRVWVWTDSDGVVRPLDGPQFARMLREAGRRVGVRVNCTRGRHTRCAAWLAQGRQLAFVKFYMSGPQGSINVLSSYIELIGMGLLNHLKRPAWFLRAPPAEGS